MNFNKSKHKEAVLVFLMLKKQKEFLEDPSKTFEDGVKFGWLGTEILTTYRYNNCQENISKGQQDILDRSLEYIKDLNIPEEWFNSDWLEENYLQILKDSEC